MEEERLAESGAEGTIGTTGRGIGPCYQDKVGRPFGIRVGELLHPDHLRERLRHVVPLKNRLLHGVRQRPRRRAQAVRRRTRIADEYLGYAEQLRPYVDRHDRGCCTTRVAAGKRILFEAAQGSLLDVDHGTYPYVTSSSSRRPASGAGSGVPAQAPRRASSASSRRTPPASAAGRSRPNWTTAPTASASASARSAASTAPSPAGRGACGWFDAVAVRYTAALAGADEMTVMLLDVLSGLPS